MKPVDFLQTPEAGDVFERAARFAGVPVSVHFVKAGREQLRVRGHGQCAICRYLAGLKGGKAACRRDRQGAALIALRDQMLTPFICHMGFACMAAPVLSQGASGFVATFGPYCPAEESRALAPDVLDGLATLTGGPVTELPVELDDVHLAPVATVPAVIEWVLEELAVLRQELSDEPKQPDQAEADEARGGATKRRKRLPRPRPDAYQARAIAAALAGGKQGQARALVKAVVAESRSGKRVRLAVRRARTVALVAAALEAAEAAGLNTGACWERFPEFVTQTRSLDRNDRLVGSAMAVLSILKRRAAREAPAALGYGELNEIVLGRLTEGVTLNEVALHLGQRPSTITKRLQRKFGLSYSDYVGRLRVDKAKELLRRTQLPVREVAWRVGIKDASNLGKLFRKFEAVSPANYRAQFATKTDHEA